MWPCVGGCVAPSCSFSRLARECGYDFIVGVHDETHKAALKFADPSLKVVVMDWC
ncbi:DUF6310 domain-containing protein [Archangium minus]